MDELQIRIKNKHIKFIYSDNLKSLTDQGKTTICRASHVEPYDKGWQADLSPVDGPVLGPFVLRIDALKAEMIWLKENHIPIPNSMPNKTS